MTARLVATIVLAGTLALGLVLEPVLPGTVPTGAQTASAQGNVTMEWLGWMFFRFTSPRGTVVLTSPHLDNPDSPYTLNDDLGRVDLILVPNGHSDDMGRATEIAIRTGARVIAPGPLGRWMIEQGVPAPQVIASGIGNMHDIDGITIRVVHNLHDHTISADASYGGVPQGYIVTFENGFTVYFAASSAIHQDMALYGRLYRPNLALLNLGGSRDPADLAYMAQLLLTDNPNLQTVVPQHHRAGDPKLSQAAAEIQRLGLPVRFLVPVVLQPYQF
jgi:L-ascorbate metabolism protein UlaG (beta-lactamase superfamily)